MNKYGLEFHHFGLAVTKPDKAIPFLKGLNYSIGEHIYDNLQNVNLVFCTHDLMPDVEIIYRADSAGPLDNLLKKNTEIIYHLCYSCSDLKSSLKGIQLEHRFITISEPKPAILFKNKMVSFYKILGFGMIEIVEEKG